MNKKLLTAFALAITAAFSMAQDNYTVKMNMKIDGLPAEYAGFGEQEIVNYVKGDKYKQEMTSMMGSTTTNFDGKLLTFVSEQMGDKSGYTATKEELEAAKTDKAEAKPKIEYTTEKKMIAGYECTKVIMSTVGKDKKTDKMNLWVTDKIKNPQGAGKMGGRRGGMGMDMSELKGYPLEIEIAQKNDNQEIKILITTSEVSTANIDDGTFKVSTDGYKMLTYKEYTEKMKAAMAGH
jgi:hypothetical protein